MSRDFRLTLAIVDKLEDAVVELERRRIEKDEAQKAQRAAEALRIATGAEKPLNDADVNLIVRMRLC